MEAKDYLCLAWYMMIFLFDKQRRILLGFTKP